MTRTWDGFCENSELVGVAGRAARLSVMGMATFVTVEDKEGG